MRKFLLILAVALMSLTASAEGYNRVYFGYSPNISMFEFGSFNDIKVPKTVHGFQLGYARGIKILRNAPLYVEVGGYIKYNQSSRYIKSSSGETIYGKTTAKLFTGNIPIIFTYRYEVGAIDGLTIAPYIGINGTFNTDMTISQVDSDGDSDSWSAHTEVFQCGMQLGVGAIYKKFYLGLGYFNNFGHVADWFGEKAYAQGLNLTVGYEF